MTYLDWQFMRRRLKILLLKSSNEYFYNSWGIPCFHICEYIHELLLLTIGCRFIDAICDTPLMKAAHEFLRDKGKAPGNINDFKKLLYKTWFKLYRRTKGDR